MSLESPFSVLFDSEGTELAVTASQSGSFEDGTQAGLLLMGSSSAGAQFLRTTNDGTLFITGTVIDSIDITGALVITGTVNQGDAGSVPESWFVRITDGTQVLGTGSSAPLFVTGNLALDPNSTVVVSGATFDGDNLLVAVSGVNVLSGALTITGSVTLGEQPIEVTGTLSTTPLRCPNTTVTGFGASSTVATVLPANALRCGATFFMDGNSRAFIKLGTGASTTDFSVEVRNNGYFELPGNYTGVVTVVFNNNNAGNVLRITEITE